MLLSSWVRTGRRPTASPSPPQEVDDGRTTIAITPIDRVEAAVRAATDKKANDVVVLDVSDLLGITDYFVICSAPSQRQIRTITDEIVKRLRSEGVRPVRREGERDTGWVLVDYEDFVVHVFGDEEREFYDLERLWKDAPRVELVGAEEATG